LDLGNRLFRLARRPSGGLESLTPNSCCRDAVH